MEVLDTSDSHTTDKLDRNQFTINLIFNKEVTMFCYQCEQTAKGEGCTKVGVCGKAT